MDVKYINPFIASVKHVFKTMLQTEIAVGKVYLKDKDAPYGDASALIGFSGDAAGCVILCFPMKTASSAASTFAGAEMTPAHEDFADALGELANMVAGQAKAQFDGLNIAISLPSVVVGKEHSVSKSKQQPTIVLPCDSALGRFAVEVSMATDRNQKAAREEAVAAAN